MEFATHLQSFIIMGTVTTFALLCGLILMKLRQPAIVGYIIAGLLLGPAGFKIVSNSNNIQILAEFGVVMLLFVTGMEVSLRGLKDVYKTALSTAILQIILGIMLFSVIGVFFDWNFSKIFVLGVASAMSSTSVAIKMLEETDDLKSPVGTVSVATSVAQDLAVVPMLLVISVLGAEGGMSITEIVLKFILSIVILLLVIAFLLRGRKFKVPMIDLINSNPEIMALASLAFCFTLASMSGMLGFSTGYGAFISGLIIGNSSLKASIHRVTLPIQAVLLMVFFLSIGFMIDLNFIFDNLQIVLIVLLATTVIKTVINIAIFHALREPWDLSFHSGVAISSIGEFAFIVAASGLAVNALSQDDYLLMITVIALSLLISPVWLSLSRHLRAMAMALGTRS